MLNLTIDNFRGFKNSEINISKTNILIGENSGGKSSFIKLLLLLKQSMETPNRDKKIILDGYLLDLGNFDKFINHISEEKVFTVSVSTDEYYMDYADEYIKAKDSSSNDFKSKYSHIIEKPTILNLIFKKDENEVFSNYITICNANIGELKINLTDEMLNREFSDIENLRGELVLNHVTKGIIKINVTLSVYGFMLLVHPEQIITYAKEINDDDLFTEFAFLLLSQNYFGSVLRSIKYINPIKFEPTRILLKRDSTKNKNIQNYETLINVLASLKESSDPVSIEILEKFNSAIHEIGIAEEVFLETNSTIPVSELKVKTGGIWNSIVDVGYGVGLQIPIILQTIICFVQKSNDILIIEQPEIHLHPALHAKFIEVLIKYAGNTRFIIETHSEHIIRKLQVLSKKEFINKNEINIYYFKNTHGLFEISNHDIAEDGHLVPSFPKGFYDNSYTLSRSLYES
jgi:predicted ATPase